MATLKNLTEREAMWIWDYVMMYGRRPGITAEKPAGQGGDWYSITVEGVTRPQLAEVRRQLRSGVSVIRVPWSN